LAIYPPLLYKTLEAFIETTISRIDDEADRSASLTVADRHLRRPRNSRPSEILSVDIYRTKIPPSNGFSVLNAGRRPANKTGAKEVEHGLDAATASHDAETVIDKLFSTGRMNA
jgi:hypothetical protein